MIKMSNAQLLDLIDSLPEDDQKLIHDFIKKVIIAWDPDYTKLTIQEMKDLKQAQEEIEQGEYVTIDEIDW